MRTALLLVSMVLLAASIAWGQTSKATIEQTTKPLALEEARLKCPISLPEGAKKIHYAYYSDVTVGTCFSSALRISAQSKLKARPINLGKSPDRSPNSQIDQG